MKMLKWSVLLVIIGVAFTNCQGKKQESTSVADETDSLLATEFPEPDSFFESALEKFNQGDNEGASEDINDAIFFLRDLNFESDTLNDDILEFAIADLEAIQETLIQGGVGSEDVLKVAFSSVDASIASYHLAIVAGFFENGGDNKEGLERLFRALVRLDNATAYQGYELTEEEKTEIDKLKSRINEVEKSNSNLYGRVNTFFERLDKKISN